LSNTTEIFKSQLLTNINVFNRGYDEHNDEFLILERRVTQSSASLDFNLHIWLTSKGCIRYEFSDPHETE